MALVLALGSGSYSGGRASWRHRTNPGALMSHQWSDASRAKLSANKLADKEHIARSSARCRKMNADPAMKQKQAEGRRNKGFRVPPEDEAFYNKLRAHDYTRAEALQIIAQSKG